MGKGAEKLCFWKQHTLMLCIWVQFAHSLDLFFLVCKEGIILATDAEEEKQRKG